MLPVLNRDWEVFDWPFVVVGSACFHGRTDRWDVLQKVAVPPSRRVLGSNGSEFVFFPIFHGFHPRRFLWYKKPPMGEPCMQFDIHINHTCTRDDTDRLECRSYLWRREPAPVYLHHALCHLLCEIFNFLLIFYLSTLLITRYLPLLIISSLLI